MNRKHVAVITLSVLAPTFALSQQQQPNAPKATKADVQKVIDSIKADKAKMANYCSFVKLNDKMEELAEKNQKDPKLAILGKQMPDSIKKIGPDFEKLMNSDLDEASSTLLIDFGTKSCG